MRPAPGAPFPAEVAVEVTVARDATVAFDGDRYGVASSLIGASVQVRCRLGEPTVRIVSGPGWSQPSMSAPWRRRRKTRRPPGSDAEQAAAQLRVFDDTDYDDFVIDLGVYARAVDAADPCGCAGGWALAL
ncbi:MAG: Mu transposase domain-containing protein [Egibacteraceae bacterium]